MLCCCIGVTGEASVGLPEAQSSSTMSRTDLRKANRRAREAQWAAFEATKPDDTYEAPADVDALQNAKATIGDFKLKSDPDFVLPEVSCTCLMSTDRVISKHIAAPRV